MLDLQQSCTLCEELVAKGGTLVSVNDVGSSESTEVLKDAAGSLGRNVRMHRSSPGYGCSPYHPVGEDRCGLCVDSQKDCRMRT